MIIRIIASIDTNFKESVSDPKMIGNGPIIIMPPPLTSFSELDFNIE